MCGRFTLTSHMDALLHRFSAVLMSNFADIPNFNIAPTQPVLGVVREDGENLLKSFRWGLIPSWSKDPKIGARMINARSETINEKPSFRSLLSRRRCLIPATGFYEWALVGKSKKPYYIKAIEENFLAFAGLWDLWIRPDGELLYSCTIITTKANSLIEPVHHRMPVILSPEEEHIWLDEKTNLSKHLLPLLKPLPCASFSMYQVDPQVNSPANNNPKCIIPLEK